MKNSKIIGLTNRFINDISVKNRNLIVFKAINAGERSSACIQTTANAKINKLYSTYAYNLGLGSSNIIPVVKDENKGILADFAS